MESVYPGDRDREPDAMPGVYPDDELGDDVEPLILHVDGEVFALRPDTHGGMGYTWLSGPNPGYGFGMGPARDLSLDEHCEHIRGFLAMIDPQTGYIADD
ncbi:MAG TPA: hypothetical protein VLC50_05810 [Actinomycetes bacterium]|nr:hypothetical protein [Actinomycetes bacterium]